MNLARSRFVRCCLMAAIPVCLAFGCRGVVDNVLTDFGLREAPEPEVDVEEVVRTRAEEAGRAELDRLNADPANVEVKFEKYPDDPIGAGEYHKEKKVYERFYVSNVDKKRRREQSPTAGVTRTRYEAVIEYRYAVFEGPRYPNHNDALASKASTRTERGGIEKREYRFDQNGQWDGKKGALVR